MERDFDICPHCAAHGRHRLIRPATPQRTPLVSRSDGKNFHVFVEESNVRRDPNRPGETDIAALFRYDLDSAAIRGDSILVVVKGAGGEPKGLMAGLQKAADAIAALLDRGEAPTTRYCELQPSGALTSI